jgi:phage/plasmid-like protein (TIGR03299 family)
MAHNLNFNTELGRHAFVSRREIAWHKLGITVEDAMTSEEAIKLAGLNYEVNLSPLVICAPGTTIPVTDHYGTYRKDTNTYFGVVGTKYSIVQNTEAFAFFDNIVECKEAMFETAGALGNGETIFITAKLPDYIAVGKEQIDKYLLFTSSHDGSGSVKVMFTPIRVVCNNTLNLALSGTTNKLVIKHTKGAHNKLLAGSNLLGLVNQHSEYLSTILNELITKPVTDEQVVETIYDVYLTPSEHAILKSANYDLHTVEEISTKKKNVMKDVYSSIYSGIGQDTYQHTAYWLYNGFTTYYNNIKKYDSNEDRFDSLCAGGIANTINQVVFDKLTTNL